MDALPPTGDVPTGTSAPDTSGRPWWVGELERRRAFADALGGPDRVEQQHAAGRQTARERVEALVDQGSWEEIGRLTGAAQYDANGRLDDVVPSNVVTGLARIGGRPVCVVAEDFTVRGGSSEATNPEKWQYAERLGLAYRLPVIRLVETAGGSITLLEQAGATKIPGYAHWPLVEMMGTVPVVGVCLGAAAGLGAVRVVSSHFSAMVAGQSWVFAGGPAVVRPGVGETVTKDDLGGSDVHARGSGVVDNEAQDEDDALGQVRRFLSFLPSSVFDPPPTEVCEDPLDRCDDWLAAAVPSTKRQVYDMRRILRSIVDEGSLFEIGRFNGRSQITALARLGGRPVAVLANDPRQLGGALTAESAEKITRFVDLADTFHLPVVNLVDQPGTFVGTAAEAKGTVRKGIRAAAAMEQVTVPWCTVFVRRAFGLAGSAYGPVASSVNWRYAWPTAYWGSIPIEGGVEAAYRRALAEAGDPQAMRDDLVSRFRRLENPFRTAERFGIQDLIDPRQTRPLLCSWSERVYRLLPENLGQKRRVMRC